MSIDAPAEAAQVDMALRLEGRRINHAVSETVAEAAALLLAITPAPHGMRHLDAYRRSFEARYGPNAEVPLVELLDPAVRLGPPPEHVHGIADDAERVAVRQRTLRALALDALRDHRLEVDLDDATLPDLAGGRPRPSLPTFAGPVGLRPRRIARRGRRGCLRHRDRPQPGRAGRGRNLGRFCDLLGPEADLALTEIARAESAMTPNAVWAEVTYLPHNRRSANVTVRPCVRDYRDTGQARTPEFPPTG